MFWEKRHKVFWHFEIQMNNVILSKRQCSQQKVKNLLTSGPFYFSRSDSKNKRMQKNWINTWTLLGN